MLPAKYVFPTMKHLSQLWCFMPQRTTPHFGTHFKVDNNILLVESKIILSQVYFRQVEIFSDIFFFVFTSSSFTFEEFVILISFHCWKIIGVVNLAQYNFTVLVFEISRVLLYIDSGFPLPSRTPYFTVVLCESSCFARVRCFFNNRIHVSWKNTNFYCTMLFFFYVLSTLKLAINQQNLFSVWIWWIIHIPTFVKTFLWSRKHVFL